MRSKAWRRHQKFRMRERAKRHLMSWAFFSREDAIKQVRYMADNMKMCSGPCCGNPRKWFGEKTIQERKAKEVA